MHSSTRFSSRCLALDIALNFYVRSFVDTKSHFTVPLDAHAFSLESKFSGPAAGELFRRR